TETGLPARRTDHGGRASMGPSRVRDGDHEQTYEGFRRPRASMGPSRVRDGDSALFSTNSPMVPLQWGRRVFATETGRAAAAGPEGARASMGPSRVRDGD